METIPKLKFGINSAVDGDTINFYFDGKLIYPNLGLVDSPQVYKPGQLSKGQHTIGVKSIKMERRDPYLPI